MVEFRLLGDVAATVDDEPIDLGHARQRCVLAALLVDANRAVPVDQLVDQVWGQRPPRHARNALYVYVSRLRQALAPSDEVRIVRQPTGYLLAVDPAAVDLQRFRNLTGQARTAETDAQALALFEQALELWRGEPFAALDTPWLATVRDELNRQRLSAELDRADLALGQGRHAELLAPLTAAARAYPLDERLAGQLMLALYRSDRQADALALYERLRLHLADELGADPNPRLQRLHRQILTADPALAVPAGGAARPAPPRQLPAPPRSFAGRSDAMASLDALLEATSGEQLTTVVVAAVSGTAGIGKTALAVHWAHRVSDRFPDGQLYVNLRGFHPDGQALDPSVAVRGFLDALGVASQRIPAELEAQAALYRTELAGRRLLVVLDNARDSAQVRPLLPGTPGPLVVVTSRHQLTGLTATDGACPIVLDLLSTAEARELLTRRLGADRVAAEPEVVGDIIARCAGLPLALTVVAARAATRPHLPLHGLADELRDASGRLDALATDDPDTDVRAVFSWSYRALTVEAAQLFRLLGLHPGPDLSSAAAASLAALPLSRVRAPLAELVRASLLVEHAGGRFALHDLLRAYATDLAHTVDTDQRRQAATYRMLDHYLHSGYHADRVLNPARDPITLSPPQPGVTPESPSGYQQAMAWFATEHAVLLAAVDHAASTGFDTPAWQLVWTLENFLDRCGHWHDYIAIGHTALAAAQRLADQAVQVRAHQQLAYAYVQTGRFDEAHANGQRALELATQAGDVVEQAYIHRLLGYLWVQQSRHTQALEHARRALALFRAAGHRSGLASALGAVGWIHSQLDDHRQALALTREALGIHQEDGNRDGQAGAWDSIGYAYHHLGDPTRAMACYQHALDTFRDLGHRYNEATTLIRIGDAHRAADDPQAADTAWRRALTILDELQHPDAEHVRAKLAAAS